jgi:hypothetical protein
MRTTKGLLLSLMVVVGTLLLLPTAQAQCGGNDCCQADICGPRYLCADEGVYGCQCKFASPIVIDTTGEGFH